MRIDAPKRDFEALAKAGACSRLGRTRPEVLFELDAFSTGGAAALEKARETRLGEYPLEKILAFEDEVLEMTPTAHPMVPFRVAAGERGAVAAVELERYSRRLITLAGFLVTRRRAPTKNGGMMEFATLEDETDIFEVTLFPDAYRRYGRLFRSAGPFLVKGKVENQHGACTVTAGYIDYLLPGERYRFREPEKEAPDDFDPEATVPQLFGL
jgi:DNA polymerase III alpha subunit